MTGLQKAIKFFAIGLAVLIIFNIFGAVMFALGFVLDAPFFSNDSLRSFTESYENVKKIDIDLSYSNLIIVKGEQFSIEAKDVSSSFSSENKNGTLKIREKSKWFFFGGYEGEVILVVPQYAFLDELDIDAGAGKISIDGIRANKFDLDQGAGVVTIQNSEFTDSNIDGGAGEIRVQNVIFSKLDVDAGVGKVTMEASILKNGSIECGVGSIHVVLLGEEEDYQILAEKGLGNISIANTGYSSNAVYGKGNRRLEVEGGIGDIIIEFMEPKGDDVDYQF